MGGHAHAVFSHCPSCIIHAVDADPHMIATAERRLADYAERVVFFNQWFDDFFEDAAQGGVLYDAVLMDLGLCMYHFKESERGFSRFGDEDLDMRLNAAEGSPTAADIINTYDEASLAAVLFAYGEEPRSRIWAKKMIRARSSTRIVRTKQLLEILQLGKKPSDGKIITRIFQALRIETNRELERVYGALANAWKTLAPNGILAVISFHSLEDRIVKQFSNFVCARAAVQDTASKSYGSSLKNEAEVPIFTNRTRFLRADMPRWEHAALDPGRSLTKKPVTAGEEELLAHPESRSAKLRVMQKI